ncbi:adenylate cyclase [Mycolicibacterium celeriflavum]|uniref:nuclear transport factor 2 family protein n=1 Tax=Mycolicibacterium celeriflavum TaxID=1249101 RepID=UPI000801E501|nr:nuclear transport factor 2 family protein [Mycolicibacterium celeriflavum]OBG22969.1 adenylate cyclase [Mycolicibacterium celeriflavum]
MAENVRTCTSCGTMNEEDAGFCEGCGGSLARVCGTCGIEANVTARFCRGCGASLEAQAAQGVPGAGPVRKTVTVMFADLAGSTTFEERVDAETAREVIGRYHSLLRSTAEGHRAGVTKYIGDGFMAVWGVPAVGPDDAAHAVDAAVELQERFVDLAARVAEAHAVELALRVAVNTGEVVVGADDADLVGDALNVGARLEAECPRGHVVVGEETWRSTRSRYGYESLGQVQVKGRSAPVAVYQWLGRQAEAADAAPFVGRGEEVRRLQAVLDDAVAARAARLVTVIGDPGVGKSRLAAEFTLAQGNARVMQARCDVEGTVALAPIVEMLRVRDLETDLPASVPERDRLLRDLNCLATGVPCSVEENFWALRRFVEVLAWSEPIVLVLDDIQWADTLLLDFIEHLVEWVQEVPVLVLALARPELREIRLDLVAVGRWVSEAVHLDGLDPGATAELAATVLGAAQLPDDLLRRLPSSTGGNPLFVRELIGMLAHDGVLVEQPVGWRLTIDVDAIAIPPTIHALLASRLERLDPTDRRVLEVASVVGSDFSLGAVRALAGGDAAGVTLSLNRLRRLELAQPSGTYVGDEPVWRFHHVLIRDVAYRRLLKSDRADLHEQLADRVEAGGPSVAFDADEMVARHLETAHAYRVELGTLDDHTSDLALRSARHYAASARRALDRDELVSAGTQAACGATLAAADRAVHAELLLIGCEAFLSAGDVAAGAPLVDDLECIADEALAPWATCYRCQFVVYTDPERLLEVDARLQDAIDEFGRRNDPAGLAKAHRVRASARLRLGRVGDGEVDLFEALIAARQSGDHRQITAALVAAPGAALWGPSPVPKAGGRCLDVVRMQRMTTAAPSLEATSMRHLAVLELLRGRPDKARTMLADARQIVADLGLRHGLMETELFAGIIELMEADPFTAEPHFRTSLEGLDALGVGADAGQAAALLARSVLAQGRIDEADRYATESEHLAGRNLKTAIAWRAVRAEILSTQGRHEEATAIARDAVAVAAGTDIVLDHAEACLALSRVLAAAGDAKGAKGARKDAENLYAAKEVATKVSRAAAPVISVEPPAPAQTRPTTSRLEIANQASRTVDDACRALQTRDVDGVVAHYSDGCTYEDRRGSSGNPVDDPASLRASYALLIEQYSHIEVRTLAVRGERLAMTWTRGSNDAGFESAILHVYEAGNDGRFTYEARFDEADFEGAYRELEGRYYAGEGATFAEEGIGATESIIALNHRDFDRLLDDLSTSDFHVENRTRSAVPNRSVIDLRASFGELDAMVASTRTWLSAMCWLSPEWNTARLEREAVGRDGEQYAWTRILVVEVCGGRMASMCEFELDDEEAAFAYAEERMRATTSRLAVANQSCEFLPGFISALQTKDVDGSLNAFSKEFVYDDHRRLSGDPIVGLEAMRRAIERIFEQYSHFEFRVLAVRGSHLNLLRSRWTDEDGNESTTLYVNETDSEGRVFYHGRFDEDDFEGAYRELERRYYTSEGAAFADAGAVATEAMCAMNQGDFDRMFGASSIPEMRVENRSRSAFPSRTAAEVRAGFEELNAMVASTRTWLSVLHWASPTVTVARFEREAIGQDGEQYTWTRLYVNEIRDERIASMCQFEVDDEAAAFAYAEERVHAAASRLEISNLASDSFDVVCRAMRNYNADIAIRRYSETFVYDDHRRISGAPVVGLDAMRTGIQHVCEQYPYLKSRTLAVRGERLELRWARQWDDTGNETSGLLVLEVNKDGLISYQGRFDEDDFEGAYRELELRYYAGEGAASADCGVAATEGLIAINRGEFDRFFGEFCTADLHVENRSRSAIPDRSAADLLASLTDLNTLVASSRTWFPAVRRLSPTWSVVRVEREAIGQAGEQYAWTRILVCEHRDGRFASMCEFEIEDEEAAFAYAEERARATAGRLAVANRASEAGQTAVRAMQAHDVDGAAAIHSDRFEYDDRRRLRGDPLYAGAGVRSAFERVFEQYTQFEARTLAVRGERLNLGWGRWSNESGYETTHLSVIEVGNDGRIEYHGRFDDDDFEGAYRELDRRYYAGEGAAFAKAGATVTEWALALNRADFDILFGEINAPDLRVVNRSRSAFPDRSASEYRTTLEALAAMVVSARSWCSAMDWMSPNCCVLRCERDAVDEHGEHYTWLIDIVLEVREGRIASMCEFDLDDEESAFTYAEERIRTATSQLAVTNRATQTWDALWRAARSRDFDAMVAFYKERFRFDDRRRLRGMPPTDLRKAAESILKQYTEFDGRTLAVRGERLHLGWARWSNDAGYETAYLFVHEIDGNGRFVYEGRFDEDDFEGAYRELDCRYYAGEGGVFAEAGASLTDYPIALGRGDFDQLFGELADPDFQVEDRSQSVFGERTLAEIRATYEDLYAMVASVRVWHSAGCWLSPALVVARFEQEAVGTDGEVFTWAHIDVAEIRGGRMAHLCLFEVDDEEAAFEYAEEHLRANTSRLAVTNRASQMVDVAFGALQAHDVDRAVAVHSDRFVHDDRRRLSGDPIEGAAALWAAADRIVAHYPLVGWRTLAVRGELLELRRSRWSDDAGNEATYLHVFEIADDGQIEYHGRFDEGDFEGAYRELARRYYTGEGAGFTEAGGVETEYMIAYNAGDFDRLLGDLSDPGLRVESRSSSVFGDRSTAEFRTSLEQLSDLVSSMRTWNSAVHWLSPDCCVARNEREAVGPDGEQYAWTRLYVSDIRGGRVTSLCEFDLGDEASAFAYAEDRVRRAENR